MLSDMGVVVTTETLETGAVVMAGWSQVLMDPVEMVSLASVARLPSCEDYHLII